MVRRFFCFLHFRLLWSIFIDITDLTNMALIKITFVGQSQGLVHFCDLGSSMFECSQNHIHILRLDYMHSFHTINRSVNSVMALGWLPSKADNNVFAFSVAFNESMDTQLERSHTQRFGWFLRFQSSEFCHIFGASWILYTTITWRLHPRSYDNSIWTQIQHPNLLSLRLETSPNSSIIHVDSFLKTTLQS